MAATTLRSSGTAMKVRASCGVTLYSNFDSDSAARYAMTSPTLSPSVGQRDEQNGREHRTWFATKEADDVANVSKHSRHHFAMWCEM